MESKYSHLPLKELKALDDLIPTGADHPITRAELENKAKYDDRTIRNAIHELRATGMSFICSGTKGYYHPTNDEQLIAFYRVEMSRLTHLYEAIKPVEDYLIRTGNIKKETTVAGTTIVK